MLPNAKIFVFGLGIAGLSLLMPVRDAAASDAPSTCDAIFLNGQRPTVDDFYVRMGQQEVCYPSYDDLFNDRLRVPVYSAEHLTAQTVTASRGANRKGIEFFPEPSLPENVRSELSDYRSSGYDRGHMANWADAADPNSFSLANILPQNSDDNRHLWEGIESRVRDLSVADGDVYVVSGPIFIKPITYLRNRIAVPTYLFKAVYDPRSQNASVYLVKNTDGDRWTETTVSILTQMTGIDVFPSLPKSVKDKLVALPIPRVHGHPDNLTTLQEVAGEPMTVPDERPTHEEAPFSGSALRKVGSLFRHAL